MNIRTIKKELKKYASAERRKINERFFKTGKGEYGEGDKFIGVRVPNIRKISKRFVNLQFPELEKLLHSEIHEERLCAILILVERNRLAMKNNDVVRQKQILKVYLRNLKYANNWDLVDLSAHHILGNAILRKVDDEKILSKLVLSEIMWERRIAIVSTFAFIREGKISETLRLSKKLLGDKEDLMHKAVGWMLREAWKKESQKVEKFLMRNYNQLPRTTLRYAIERMEEKKRKRFLKGEF